MTQEDKELLFKDLAARLPYGVKCHAQDRETNEDVVITLCGLDAYETADVAHTMHSEEPPWFYGIIGDHEPYLRPMSSMTEEEKVEYEKFFLSYSRSLHDFNVPSYIDWLNKKMFDYRGLIEKGLALEAPEGMYNKQVKHTTMDENKSIEIPFGAKDSELKGWEYTIPEGMEAEIKDGKIIVREKENEDERIRREIITYLSTADDKELIPYNSWIAWLEKQGEKKPVISDEAIREGVAHFGITQYQINNWLKKYIDIEKQGEKNEHAKHPDMVANLKEYLANTPKEQLEKDWDELKRWNNVGPTVEEFLYGKQNPAWSKEDEKMFEFWNLYYDHKVGDMPNKDVVENLEKFRDWLKSLKERYTWKPSEKQMEILQIAHNRIVMMHDSQANEDASMIRSLIDDLKKLK